MQQHSPIRIVHDFARRNQIVAEYRFEKEFGPTHAKMFTVRLYLGAKEYVGTERTMTLAQCAAAQLALEDHQGCAFGKHYNAAEASSPIPGVQSACVEIHAWAARNHVQMQYLLLDEKNLIPSSDHCRLLFSYRLYLGHDLHFDGHGSSHHQARTHCALNALTFLRQRPLSPPSTPQLNSPSSSHSSLKRQTKSDVSLMYERAHQLGLAVHIEFNDPLTVTYHLGEHYSAKGTGFNQHSAKQFAAKRMLQILSSPKTRATDGQPSTEANPVARLHQLAQARHVKLELIEVNHSPSEPNFTIRVQFDQKELAEGHGKTKQLAKRAAAEISLEKLEPVIALPLAPCKGVLKRSEGNDPLSRQEKKHVHFADDVVEKDEPVSVRSSSSSSSPSSPSCSRRQQLTNACQRLKIDVNYLDELSPNSHSGSSRHQSIVSLSTGERLLAQFRGHGPSSFRAQENASSAAWNNLKQLFAGSTQALPSH